MNFKKAKEILSTTLIQKTWEIIQKDYLFFVENFVKIEDADTGEPILFKLWDKQRQVLDIFHKERLVIVLKARQLGLTWLALAYSVWCLLTQKGYKITALSKGEKEAQELVRRVKFILRNLPNYIIIEGNKKGYMTWVGTTEKIIVSHPDGSESTFLSFSASPDSGRTFTSNLVLIDEWAFQQWAEEIYTSAYPTINRPTGGKVIGISTGKRGSFFEKMWNDAESGASDFKPVFLSWRADPRRDNKWYERTERDLPNTYRQEYPCVVEGSFISTDIGIIPIEKASEATITETGRIKEFLYKGIKEAIRITTNSGRILQVTPEHLVATPDGFIEAQKLNIGQEILLSQPIFADDIYVHTWCNAPGYECRLTIDETWARFLGYFMGDGSFMINRNNSVVVDFACCAQDPDIADEISDICEKIIGQKPTRRLTGKNKGCINIRSNSKEWFPMLYNLGVLKKNGDPERGRWIRKVCVPDVIKRSPKHIIKEFLSCLFEADGSAYKYQRGVTIFSKYEDFLRDIQLLLLGFGIKSVIRKEDKKSSFGFTYTGRALKIDAANTVIFHKEIGFRSQRKKGIAAATLAKPTRQKKERIETVKEITPIGPKPVYDLVIEDEPHAFGANGILVHNCNPEDAFAAGQGAFFPEWNYDIHVINDPTWYPPPECQIYGAYDAGYGSFACFKWYAVFPNGQIVAYREYYPHHTTDAEQAEMIKKLSVTPDGYPEDFVAIYADPSCWNKQSGTGESTAEVFANHGIYMNPADNDLKNGWRRLHQYLKPIQNEKGELTSLLKFTINCANTIRTYPTIEQDKNNPEDAAKHSESHAQDCDRYLIMGRPVITETKAIMAGGFPSYKSKNDAVYDEDEDDEVAEITFYSH